MAYDTEFVLAALVFQTTFEQYTFTFIINLSFEIIIVYMCSAMQCFAAHVQCRVVK